MCIIFLAHLFADNLQDGDVRAESPLESEESSSSDEMIFDSPRKPSSSSRERSSTTDEPVSYTHLTLPTNREV